MIEVRRYLTESGRDTFGDWLEDLADHRARAKVAVRVLRLAAGNFGDCKLLREGVWELRVHWGPGYRVYFARESTSVVLLLGGGNKRRQAADIERAIDCWRDYQQRNRPR